MRKRETGGRCTSAIWHLINLTCSQVGRKQGKGTHTHTHTRTRTHTHAHARTLICIPTLTQGRRVGTEQENEEECIEKRQGGRFSLRTLYLSSYPHSTHALSISCSAAHRQSGSLHQCKDGRVWLVSVTDGGRHSTRHRFLFQYNLFREPSSQSQFRVGKKNIIKYNIQVTRHTSMSYR